MITVATQTEFKNAIAAREPDIYVANNISLTSQTSIGYAVTITGAEGASLLWTSPRASARNMLIVTAAGDLTVESLILDAEGRDGTLVQINGGTFTMNENTILRNVTGRTSQNAVSVGDMSSTDGGTFIMNGGLITGIDSSDAVFCSGGAVVMNNNAAISDNPSAGISMANARGLRASLTMTGRSRISNNQSKQGASAGILMETDVVMGVNEGDAPIVTGNQSPVYSVGGFLITSDSTLTMRYGAEISDNYSLKYGGGVVVQKSVLTMQDNAAIKNNRSDGPGAGLMLLGGSTAKMEDNAQVADNTCEGYGGGIILQGGSSLQMTGNSAVHGNSAANGAGLHIYQASVSAGLNNSSPQIYGNKSTGRGGGAFISAGGQLDFTGRARMYENTAVIEGQGIYKLGGLNLSESPQILDGLFFDDINAGGLAFSVPQDTLTELQLPFDDPDHITAELYFDEALAENKDIAGNGVRYYAGASSPTHTGNVPVIVDALTGIARIQLEASNYVSPPNVTLVIADKGPDYAQFVETDRAAWLIPPAFGPEYRVILNTALNQVLIDFKDYTIAYENLSGSSHSNPLSYTAANLPIKLSAPAERAGYLFAGWFNAQGQRVTEIPVGTTGDIKLTAKWVDHMLSFDGNHPKARNVPPPIHVEQGKNVQIPATIPLRPCHCFVCWNIPSSGSGKVYFPGDAITIGAENVTLYAQWQSMCCGYSDDKDTAPKPDRFGAFRFATR